MFDLQTASQQPASVSQLQLTQFIRVQQWPANFEGPFMIPDVWNFDHGNYLQVNQPAAPAQAVPVVVPGQGAAQPVSGAAGWQEGFTAAFESTRFR